MYVGLPIVAYDINFNRETMHGKGLFFNSTDQLQINMKLLLDNKVFRNKLGIDARQIATKHYNWNSIIKKYEQNL